jgi:DNA-binding NtrC family response regulator
MKHSLLIVDDEPDMLDLLRRSLEPDLDCRVTTAGSGAEALKLLSEGFFDLVLADIKMPGMDGLDLLEIIKRKNPQQTVVMMTAFGQIDTAVDAMRSGAYDFITKPFEHDALVLRLEKALERSTLIRENQRLHMACAPLSAFQDLVGKSAVMQRLYETIQMAAKTDLTVLIMGESGTGKDLTAHALHALSPRSGGPFVAVNCPTVPEHILESELFGYRKGAFTHATENRRGLFQEAHGGTIFLDEIGDISPSIQTKLLRVLQEKEIKPLGDTRSIIVDARIVASTNQDLRAKIEAGQFRDDFFYRLNVLPIQQPNLRDHREDIPLIANYLLEKHCALMQRPLKRISPELMNLFMGLEWRGNVRELENLVMRGISFSSDGDIRVEDIGLTTSEAPARETPADFGSLGYKQAKQQHLEKFNLDYLGSLLSSCNGNVSQAARMCGLERQALQQIIRRYGIRADDYRS